MFDEFEYDDDKMILTKSIVRYNIAQKLFILYHINHVKLFLSQHAINSILSLKG